MSEQKTTNAIVLAAGYGTRLRPLTEIYPKPLLPVCNRPLLENILLNLKSAGVSRIAVNPHHLGEKISESVAAGEFKNSVNIYPEPEILGTGGPLVNAKALLADGRDFILHNGDILTDLDFGGLIAHHREADAIVTMVLIDGPENKVRISENGNIIDILDKLGTTGPENEKLTYTGLSIYTPEIFNFLPEEPVSCSIITAILEVVRRCPGRAAAYCPDKIYWNDLGSPEQYFQAHEDILLHHKLNPPKMDTNSPVISGDNCHIAPDAELTGFVSLGNNCRIENNATVNNCVLLPGSTITAGEYRKEEIITPAFSIHKDAADLRNLKILEDWSEYQASTLLEHGSDRRFYRLKSKGRVQVLMVSNNADKDFPRFISVGKFLHGLKLMTPAIFDIRPEEFSVLMEDLGDDTVFRFTQNYPDADLETLYRKILDAIIEFHLTGIDALRETAPESVGIRIFDYDYFRWETSYFRENFLQRVCGIPANKTNELEEEFHRLAVAAFDIPKVLIHRDFQSQNIMLQDNKVRFVDFQGARVGPAGIDICALLYDPYMNISSPVRQRLFYYYYENFFTAAPEELKFSFTQFESQMLTCGLQRLMQALGAYGFLGLVKNKRNYLEFIPNGLANLREVAGKTNDYPLLAEILDQTNK